MSQFTGPARKRTDQTLFRPAGPGLSRLQKTSRKELRQQARAQFWKQKQGQGETEAVNG